MKIKITILFLLILYSSITVLSQNKMSADTDKTVKVNQKKPSIYLDFVKTGECRHDLSFTVLDRNPCESNRTDITPDIFDAVWLRLINNTRWAIEVKVGNMYKPPVVDGFSLQDKRTKTATSNGAEVDAIYDIEAETGCDYHEEAPKGLPCKMRDAIAPKIEKMGMFSTVFVPSGQSLIFAVKREHLKKYLMVYAAYNYEWETSDESPSTFEEPKHRVYYSWFKLQKATEKIAPAK